MPSNPKLYTRGSVVEVGFRTEEGLPFVATPYMKVLILAILARAQELYPIGICGFVVMPNHLHLLLVIEYPELVPDFVGQLKRELSHAVNRFLGRRKYTVHCEGYDAPRILDYEETIERLRYLYCNPQEANLVERIEDYPNLTSWAMFLEGGAEISCARIPRSAITKLPKRTLSFAEQEELAEALKAESEEELSLFVDPDCWMQCFEESCDADPHVLKDEVVRRVRQKESALRAARKKPVKGRHALRLRRMDAAHTPTKHAPRSICLGSCQKQRKRYIAWFKACHAEAKEVIRRWREGDWFCSLPPGMFAPGGRLYSNLLPSCVPA